jgi:hypothetical protein
MVISDCGLRIVDFRFQIVDFGTYLFRNPQSTIRNPQNILSFYHKIFASLLKKEANLQKDCFQLKPINRQIVCDGFA